MTHGAYFCDKQDLTDLSSTLHFCKYRKYRTKTKVSLNHDPIKFVKLVKLFNINQNFGGN